MDTFCVGPLGPGFPDFTFLQGKRLLLAFSGGADSTALFDMLVRARDLGTLSLSAAHFCHGIRGNAAQEDAAFCRALCAARGVPYYEGCGDVPAAAAASNEGLETAARRLRYRFLLETAQQTGADGIALAHHANDQAETVLMHLFRGCGPSGMGAMAPISPVPEEFCSDAKVFLVRPLLNLRKQDILKYLRAQGLTWREDCTNAVADNPRNLLRLKVLPAVLQAYPGAEEALCRHAEIAREEESLLEGLVDNFLRERLRRGPCWDYLSLDGTEQTALLRRAARRLLGREASFSDVDRFAQTCRGPSGSASTFQKFRAERAGKGLYLLSGASPAPADVPVNLEGETVLPGIGRLAAKPAPPFPVRNEPLRQVLRRSALEGAVLRVRRQGDFLRPLGLGGTKTFSDYLTDRKVDRPLRNRLPLLARDREILWAIGLGISESAALQGNDAAVELTFIREDFQP